MPAVAILDDPFLRMTDVEREVGLTKSTIYKRVREGTFPKPRSVGGGQVRWPLSAIRRWKENPTPFAAGER